MISMQARLSLAVLALVGLREAAAQITSNASCLASSKDLYNTKGQSPCLVAAFLGGACNGGQYDVSALVNLQHYIGPDTSQANPCLCSTVMYSMMGACSTCQNATVVTWDSWSTSCSSVFVDIFPEDIPADTAVPGWAYENVTVADIFNPSEATSDNSPESTATRIQTTQTAGSSLSSANPSASAGSGSSSASGSGSGGGSNTGAIAGGVVGGVVGVALIALLVFLIWRRQRRVGAARAHGGQRADIADSPVMGQKEDFAAVPYTPHAYERSGSVVGVPKLYDPNDPSTFPTSPDPSAMFNTHHTGQTATSYPTQVPVSSQNSGNQGMYRGVAEV